MTVTTTATQERLNKQHQFNSKLSEYAQAVRAHAQGLRAATYMEEKLGELKTAQHELIVAAQNEGRHAGM